MKLMLSLLAILSISLGTTQAFASPDQPPQEPLTVEVVEKELCEYLGKDVEVPGDSALAELAEDGLAVVEIGSEAVICTVEGTAYLTYKYGLKPLGQAGKNLLCTVGKGITKFLEAIFGSAKKAENDVCDQ